MQRVRVAAQCLLMGVKTRDGFLTPYSAYIWLAIVATRSLAPPRGACATKADRGAASRPEGQHASGFTRASLQRAGAHGGTGRGARVGRGALIGTHIGTHIGARIIGASGLQQDI